jgi:hypothetical protein
VNGKLLYSSRAGIPVNSTGNFVTAERAIWIYAFSKSALNRYFEFKSETKLDKIEDNEIIRFLEIGEPVYCVNVIGDSWAVDEFKDIQLSFLKSSVANAETPSDQAFLAATYHLCNKYKIKYLLSGSNFATEGILPKSWGYNAKDVKHLKAIHRIFGKVPFKTYPLLGFYREFYYTYVKKIKMVRLLNYVPYVKEDAMKVIQNELGWVYYGGKHYESVFTRFFQAYYLPKKFNYDKRLAHLSTLICSGQITRDQALEEMKKDIYPPELLEQDKEYVMKKLGLDKVEFEKILNAPAKSYKDYPNDEKKLKFIYRVYNKLRGR